MSKSIYDVAKRAGVSISTVSRVMNHSASVKESKRNAVLEAIEYYDFQPSQFGRGLATGNSKLIGVYSPFEEGSMFDSSYSLECLKGIDYILRESPYSLLLINERKSFFYNEFEKPKFLEYVNGNSIDGLILLSIPSDGRFEGYISAIIEKGFPIGYIGKKISEKAVNVYASFEEYMMKAMNILFENGHRKVVFMPIFTRASINKKLRYKASTMYEGLEIFTVDILSNVSIEFLTDIIKYMIEEKDVTAFVCEYLQKIPKIQTILASMDLHIGKEISIISIEHTRNSGKDYSPNINCFYVPAMEMGKSIASSIICMLENDKLHIEENMEVIYKPEYIDRGSVKCLLK